LRRIISLKNFPLQRRFPRFPLPITGRHSTPESPNQITITPLWTKHKIMGYLNLKNVLRPALGWPSFKENGLKLHEPGF